ncbi:MAG: hypothetical protein RLP44_01910 [Aggregatilineales bacterium]
MPITVSWIDPDKTIILLRFTGRWNWSECHKVFANELTNIMLEVSHEVYIIADFLPAANPPVNGVTHARKLFPTLPPIWRHVLVVSDDKFTHVLVEVFRTMNIQGMGQKMSNAKTLDQALNMIHTMNTDTISES